MIIAISLFMAAQVADLTAQDSLRLTVEQAIEVALERNSGVLAARADARAAGEIRSQASQGVLPTLGLRADFARTNDPVAVFGMRLRQSEFTQNDFALDALNAPDPYNNYSLSATLTQPIFSPEGFYGYRAAAHAAEAAEHGARRAAGMIAYRITEAYGGVLLARESVSTLEAALVAARAHVDQAASLAQQGLVTGLDARLAEVSASELQARLATARAESEIAERGLRTLLQLEDGTELELISSLELSSYPEPDVNVDDRADVAASVEAVEAARLARRAALGANLPALVAFGNLARHSNTSPLTGGSGDWTVGVAVIWNPFSAMSGIGRVREAAAREEAARLRLDQVSRMAALERTSAARRLEAARERATVAERSVELATEASQQAALRYGQGISPITELLDARAALTRTQLTMSQARYDAMLAAAARDLANGVYDR